MEPLAAEALPWDADVADAAPFDAAPGTGFDDHPVARAIRPLPGRVVGSGPAGMALAARLASVGHDVTLGSRSKYRAMEVRDSIIEAWPERELSIDSSDNAGASEAELIVIATPWNAATETAHSVRTQLRGKIVVCMSNALS